MKKLTVLGALILCALPIAVAYAQWEVPDGVQVFTLENGRTCVVWPDGSGDCYCPCEVSAPPCVMSTPVLRDTPTPTEEYESTPTVGPTPTPTQSPTETPVPTEKPKCNRGIGNDSEGCDPGNSYGQGKGEGRDAGEDRNEHKK